MTEKAGTRTTAVMDAVRNKIGSRALVQGDRLPSVRQFAEIMNVSPSTVVDAYDRLVAEGVIRAKPSSGFYVAGAHAAPLSLAAMGQTLDHAIDPLWVSRQSLDADLSILKPGCGWLPPEWMPTAAIRSSMRVLARSEHDLLTDYATTRGGLALRRQLLGRFAEEGLAASAEQLLLTSSATQAMDLVCRLLLHPGDTVLVDDPCYFNVLALLRAHRVHVVGVPMTPSGPDVQAFEAVLATEKPTLYITNSALHNPTGATLSPWTAHRILSAAAQHDMVIIEDDIFAEFEPHPSPRLALLDGIERVIRVGSFSKTISASLRCGYICDRAEWIEELVDLQVATNFGGPSATTSEVVANVLVAGTYRKHLRDVRQRLVTARGRVAERLTSLGIVPWMAPRAGFFLWCQLPEGLDSAQIARHCLDHGVVIAPGNVFSVSQSSGSYIRFNVAQMADDRIYTVLERSMSAA
jgi:DNA-binding transcriptional MocR family regulator